MHGILAIPIHASLLRGWSRRLYQAILDPTRRNYILCRLKHEIRWRYAARAADTLTPWPLVNFVLDEEIHHRDDRGKEPTQGHEVLTVRYRPILQTLWRSISCFNVSEVIATVVADEPSLFRGQSHRRRVRNRTEHPRHVTDDVGNHKRVVDVVMVGRRDVDPTATRERSDDANDEENKGPRRSAGLALQVVLKKHEGKARTRSQGD